MMEIKRLSESEAQALWDLRHMALSTEPDAFGESLEEHLQTPVEVTAERLRVGGEDNFVIGAFNEATLVGMVGFYRETRIKRRHRGWIWGTFVAPEWRGRGLARRLMEEAIGRARQIAGMRYVLLSVSAGQDAARGLYAGLGFEVYAFEPEAIQAGGRFIDMEHMRLKLN